MANNLTRKIMIAGIGMAFAIFAVSCANLPEKVLPNQQNTVSTDNQSVDTQGGESSVMNQNDADDTYLIRNPQPQNWSEPQSEATVTPIVLFVEKKGETGSLIIRSDVDTADYIGEIAYPTPAADITSYGGLRDEMEVYSYSPVNSAVVLPNQFMHLDVTLRNTGTTTWQTTYKVIDISANPMTVLREYYLPYAVAPQGTVMLSIFMTAPQDLGSYTESFQIQDAYGAIFGNFDYVLTVGGFSSITEIPTLTATVTPTYYSAEGITATPDGLAWMCIDPERSKLQDCYQFCVEYSDREEFRYCFYDGIRYTTPIP